MKKTFSIKKLFNDSVEDYKKYWGMFILIGIIFAMVALLANIGTTPSYPYGMMNSGSFLVIVISWLLQSFLTLGFIRMLLSIVDKKETKLEELFHGANSFNHFLYFVVTMILYSALVSLGTILFIIPGIILSVGFIFVQYLAAEEREGIFESFKRSWKMTKGNRWKIFWLMIVSALFNVLGLLALVVGLLVTVPITYLVYTHLYRTLLSPVNTPQETETIVIKETVIIETE